MRSCECSKLSAYWLVVWRCRVDLTCEDHLILSTLLIAGNNTSYQLWWCNTCKIVVSVKLCICNLCIAGATGLLEVFIWCSVVVFHSKMFFYLVTKLNDVNYTYMQNVFYPHEAILYCYLFNFLNTIERQWDGSRRFTYIDFSSSWSKPVVCQSEILCSLSTAYTDSVFL